MTPDNTAQPAVTQVDYPAEGVDAFYTGQGIEKNPYNPGTHFDAHTAWNDGWLQAEEELDAQD